jgi:hypothetical protein
MHQIMVNIKTAGIFNRFFEIQKSTRNAKNFAEIRALATWGSRVYQSGIYHDAFPAGLYVALTRRWGLGGHHRPGRDVTPSSWKIAVFGVCSIAAVVAGIVADNELARRHYAAMAQLRYQSELQLAEQLKEVAELQSKNESAFVELLVRSCGFKGAYKAPLVLGANNGE